MTWDGQEDCQECLQEAIDQQIPTLQRSQYVEMLPCSKHGHPAWLHPDLRAWLDFFNVIAPYCTETTLDHVLISKICNAYGLDFLDAFEKLTWILEIVKECQQKDSNKPQIE